MNAARSFLYAIVTAALSIVIIFFRNEISSREQGWYTFIVIFIVAFILFKLFGGDNEKKGEQQ